MVEKMLAIGASHEVIVLAIRTAEGVTLSSRDASRFVTATERSPAAIRAARHRQKLKQQQGEAKANDVASSGDPPRDGERDASRDDVTERCNLSFFSEEEGVSKEGSKEAKKD